MSGHNQVSNPPTSLDPETTPQGAMERVFLAEVHSPDHSDYSVVTSLEEMRDMRQAIETRLKNPADYAAPGAKSQIDIIKAHGQIRGFGNYPEISPGIQTNINEIIKSANNLQNPKQAVYAQYVRDAVTAATENIENPAAGYPNATAWVTKGKPAPCLLCSW